ncbi:MAG: hypothetical protein JWP02_2313 [Acidimicrobiales bacterium]|nr:hypothetical protein [Acidimicrobiales bacterium]
MGARLKKCPFRADFKDMADLSNLLGAVYGEGPSPSRDERDEDGPPVPVEPSAAERAPDVPAWADDEHLDAAFAQWKPGPAPGTVEHEVVAGEPGPAAPLADDLAAALSEALVAHENEPDDDEDDEFGVQHVTPERAAAAELTAATRFSTDPEPLPAPVAEAEPVPAYDNSALLASMPYASDEPKQAKHAKQAKAKETEHMPAMPAPQVEGLVPAAARVWERSDDDILPSKGGGRGFFSLSLRRG